MDGSGAERETPLPCAFGDEKGKRGGEEAGSVPSRLLRYGNAKGATLALLEGLGVERAVGLGLRWRRIRECGEYLKFRDYYQRETVKLVGANFCKNHLTCGLCAIRRGARGMAAYFEKAEAIPGFGVEVLPFLVTTTVRNGPGLRERLGHLLRSYRLLLDCRHGGTRRASVMPSVLGGVYSVEVTNKGKGWHPHVHAIWLLPASGAGVDTLTLRREWEAITRDSFECDVRAVARCDEVDVGVSPYAQGFAEVFKYATKPAELGATLFAEAYPVLRGRRLLGSFGCLRGVAVPESLADDVRGLEFEPYVEFLARYVAGAYRVCSSGEVRCA